MEPSAPEAARAPAVRAAATAAAATRMRMGRLGLVVMAVTSDSVWEQREARARRCSSTRDGALPDFTLAEAALRTAYFSHLYRIVHCQYTGRTQKVLLRALGEQIDLLNIIHVLRLKTYFPQTEPETYLRVLFPFHYRLNPDFTRALCAAPGVDDVFALLRDSPYRGKLGGVGEPLQVFVVAVVDPRRFYNNRTFYCDYRHKGRTVYSQ